MQQGNNLNHVLHDPVQITTKIQSRICDRNSRLSFTNSLYTILQTHWAKKFYLQISKDASDFTGEHLQLYFY